MRKKNIIKTGLLSAALLLGTGYAVINNRVLTATGTVPIAGKDLDVGIGSIEGDVSEVNISENKLSASFKLKSTSEFSLPMEQSFHMRVYNLEPDLAVNIQIEATLKTNTGEELDESILSLENTVILHGDYQSPVTYIEPNVDVIIPFNLSFGDNYELIHQYEYLTVEIVISISPKLD